MGWGRFFRRGESDAELQREIELHVEEEVAENVARGMPEGEARRRARVKFGSAQRVREAVYEQQPGWFAETVWQDVRYAVRGFRRNPIFTVTVVVILALGIGATTAVFSVVDPILFRSLPYGHADRLVSLGLTAPISPKEREFMLGGSYYDWRDNQRSFEGFTAEGVSDVCDLTDRNPARLMCEGVENDFLATLGVSPVLGRNFLPEEERPHGPKVALISYGLWLTHYGLDPGILNRVVEIDGNPVRVVGVLPKDFEMPTLQGADVVVPLGLDEAMQRKADPGRILYAFARLKPGVNVEEAAAELEPEFEYSLKLAPPAFRKEVHYRVRSLRDRQMHEVRPVAWILLGAVLALLLIACANVASLFLTRAAVRERELAVRSALGASRGRLIRQTLTEALLLAVGGAAAGVGLAEVLLRVFVAIAPAGILFLGKAQLDLRIMLFTILLSLACGIIFGLIPALQRPRVTVPVARATNSVKHAVLRRSLVVGQIAVSMMLLSSAMLLLRSFRKLQLQDLGMRTRGLLTVRVSLQNFRYDTAQKQMAFFEQVEAGLRRLPGVTAVGMGDTLPPGADHHENIYSVMAVAGRPRFADGTGGMVTWRWVTPAYFHALNVPIVRGQGFSEEERTSSEHLMVVSSLLAARMFPNEDPIGQRIQPHPEGPWYRVVGVAADVKNAGLANESAPEYYLLRRNFVEDWDQWGTAMVVESALPSESLALWVRSQIATIDPTVPVNVEMLSEQVSKLADRPRFETVLLGCFAFTGLLMAVVGLYGVTSFMAIQRTQEIGVRMALGANRKDILGLIVREGLRLIAVGAVLGLGAALGVTEMLRSLLFGVGPHDPSTFAGVALLLGLVALAAILIPARAAMNVEPTVALRCE
jgi:putative ABC transport system permease protein